MHIKHTEKQRAKKKEESQDRHNKEEQKEGRMEHRARGRGGKPIRHAFGVCAVLRFLLNVWIASQSRCPLFLISS